MPVLLQLLEPDFQLAAQQFPRAVGAAAQNLVHAHEVRLVVHDDARIRRYGDFAVGEGVQRVDRPVRRLVVADVDDDLDLIRSVVVDFLDLDFTLVVGFDDRFLDRLGRRAVGYLGDRERPLVDLVDPRADLDRPAAQSVVVPRHVAQPARREIGIELERLAAQIGDRRVDQLVEIVRQDFRRQSDGDSLDALREQQRKLDRKRHGLLIAAVVGEHPLGGLRIEHDVERELRQPRLDVPRRSGSVARQDVSPVALTVDQHILLTELHERVADRSVAVRMVLHRRADDICDLVVASVVEFAHRMQDAPLHRLQSVVDVRHGTFQNHIRGIVQKPVLVHARQLSPVGPVARQPAELGRTARLGCFRNGLRLARSRSLRPAVVRRSALRDGSLPNACAVVARAGLPQSEVLGIRGQFLFVVFIAHVRRLLLEVVKSNPRHSRPRCAGCR